MYYRTWICEDCHQEVREDIFPCPNCVAKEEKPKVIEKSGKNYCPCCTFENPEFVTHCQVCETALIEVPEKIEKTPSTSVVCKSCNKENSIKNEYCVYCDEDLFDEPKKECPICSFKVKSKHFEEHYHSCLLTK